jgi:hypothetical protein
VAFLKIYTFLGQNSKKLAVCRQQLLGILSSVSKQFKFVSIFYRKKVPSFSISALKKSGDNTFCAYSSVTQVGGG